MEEFEVTCITKSSDNSTNEHVSHIGNAANRWRLTREAAIVRIESKKEAFYTLDRTTGKRSYIDVVREHAKLPYLRAHADGKWNDNLLALPHCNPSFPII